MSPTRARQPRLPAACSSRARCARLPSFAAPCPSAANAFVHQPPPTRACGHRPPARRPQLADVQHLACGLLMQTAGLLTAVRLGASRVARRLERFTWVEWARAPHPPHRIAAHGPSGHMHPISVVVGRRRCWSRVAAHVCPHTPRPGPPLSRRTPRASAFAVPALPCRAALKCNAATCALLLLLHAAEVGGVHAPESLVALKLRTSGCGALSASGGLAAALVALARSRATLWRAAANFGLHAYLACATYYAMRVVDIVLGVG
eukprot:5916445-Prymnesium_polylepis.2